MVDVGLSDVSVDTLAERITQAKQQLEQMIDLTPQSMLLMNADGTILRANRSLLRLLGLGLFAAVLGKSLEDLFVCDEAGFFARLLDGTGGYAVRETDVVLAGKEPRQLRFSVVGSDRHGDSFVIIVQDTTVDKAESQRAEKILKQEAVQALMGALMHHLNQPLTVISVRARLMQIAVAKGEATPEDLTKTLEDIIALTMKMADTLKKVEDAQEFSVEQYIEGLNILDIDK